MVTALIAAGGSSRRMGTNKLLLKLGGEYVIEKTLKVFENAKNVDGVIVVTDNEIIKDIVQKTITKPVYFAKAGKERQYSVRSGLQFVADDDIVLIHDAARPFVTEDIIDRCIESCKKYGSGVAAVPVYDSLKRADDTMTVKETVDRAGVYAMQTPQGFKGSIIKQAHKQDAFGTDDAYLVEQMGEKVYLVMGDTRNKKLTTPEDIKKMNYRIGQGYDVHKLGENRDLIICGIKIPYELGLVGHSDADVAVHALMDAMLGAIGGYDIGRLFPDSDDSFKGISSMLLLEKVNEHLNQEGYELSNCDITIIAQRPKLLPYIDDMRKNIAECLKVDISCVNVKATTTEQLGFEGRGEGISSMAVVMVKGV